MYSSEKIRFRTDKEIEAEMRDMEEQRKKPLKWWESFLFAKGKSDDRFLKLAMPLVALVALVYWLVKYLNS